MKDCPKELLELTIPLLEKIFLNENHMQSLYKYTQKKYPNFNEEELSSFIITKIRSLIEYKNQNCPNASSFEELIGLPIDSTFLPNNLPPINKVIDYINITVETPSIPSTPAFLSGSLSIPSTPGFFMPATSSIPSTPNELLDMTIDESLSIHPRSQVATPLSIVNTNYNEWGKC
jgi:hypothetical protein